MYASYAYVTINDLEQLIKMKADGEQNQQEEESSDHESHMMNGNGNRSNRNGYKLSSPRLESSDNGDSDYENQPHNMLMAIRAPPGSTIERPSEV